MVLTLCRLRVNIFIHISILMRRGVGKKKKMKAQIDKEQMGEQRIKGIKIIVKGRIRGGNRKQKKVVQYGQQNQQDRLSRIELGAGEIRTRYGTLGVKVQSAKERREGRKEERIQ